jgi:hypothetical protein
MSIQRDFLNGSGDLPILFHVSETFQAWDGQVALVLDHLLNHIKALNSLAEGPVDQNVIDVLSQHPHYQLGTQRYLSQATRENAAKTLIEECVVLLKCLVKIAPIVDIDARQRNEHLDTTLANIPFLDYHYIGDTSTSDARRED